MRFADCARQAVYQSLLHLSWIDKLLDNIRVIFTDLYRDQLKKPHTSIVECQNFDEYFDQQIQELETTAEKPSQRAPDLPSENLASSATSDQDFDHLAPPLPTIRGGGQNLSSDVTPTSTPDTSRPATPQNDHLLVAKQARKGGASRRARKAAAPPNASSGDEDARKKGKPTKSAPKKMRKWDENGVAYDDDGEVLDFSVTSGADGGLVDGPAGTELDTMNADSYGTRTKAGQYVLKDLDDEVHSILKGADEKNAQTPSSNSGVLGSSFGAISGLFRNVIGGKTLTKEDLEKPMKGMEEHLLKKNVAREAAVHLCNSVEKELIGSKTSSFESTTTHYLLPDSSLCHVLPK